MVKFKRNPTPTGIIGKMTEIVNVNINCLDNT